MSVNEVAQKLIEKKYTISFAESCTGGLAVSSLVKVPDTSKILSTSFVTYSNEAKTKYLGVPKVVIDSNGAVSEDVARLMAIGVSQKAKSNVGVGITGIAGPTGGTSSKPVGTVWIGICLNGMVYTYHVNFGDIGRIKIMQSAVDFVFENLNKLL